MAPPRRTTLKYGLPWTGYQSSVPPHMAPRDKATSDGPTSSRRSQNELFDPVEGAFFRRGGMSVAGSSTGILENGTGELTVARCRQMLSLRSPSLTSVGYPTRASLWTEEGNHKGCLHFYNTNDDGGSPYGDFVLGMEYGNAQYTTGPAGGNPALIAWPILRTTDDTIGRWNTLALRAIASCGSRRVLEIEDRLMSPNLTGTPWIWDKKFNDENGDTADTVRIQHTGRPSPLGLPVITTGTVNAVGSWHEGDEFYISVAFRYADGSVSMPIIPRDRNDDVNYDAGGAGNMSGFGKVTLARTSAPENDRYLYLSWSDIPIGPHGVVGRYLLRTPKLAGTYDADASPNAGTEGSIPTPIDLRITHYIDNNTQTAYQDPNGNDLSLTVDPLLIRFEHIMQPAARYVGTCDNRVVVGYTKPNPVAIYLAPKVNVLDTDASIDTVVYEYALTGGTLTLYKTVAGPTETSTTITNIGDNTIQSLVDLINNTSAAGGGGKWWAAVAPGADRSALCDDVGTAADNDNLVSVTGATDHSGDTAGRVRAWAPSYPACIFFSSTYLANYPTEKRRVFFTMGGPGMPTNAACSFHAANYRTAPESYGDLMGMGALNNGAVLCFSKGIAVLQNRRGGSTGIDEDYRIYDLNQNRGCISADSIVEFNGAVGYLTRDGYVVTDGQNEVILSLDIWNPATQTGEWAYEIGQCVEGSASDTDISRFSADAAGGVLSCAYRLHNSGTGRAAATDAHPLHRIEYNYSASAQASGLAGLLKPDGTPWGWSTPLTCARSTGPMCEVVGPTGVQRFMADEDSTGQTSNGRIYQIETGTQDASSNFTSRRWTARDFAGHLKKKAHQEIRPVYKKTATGLAIKVYRDGLGTTADQTISLPSTASDNFGMPVLPLAQAARSQSNVHEYLLEDDGTGSEAPRDWGFEADVELVDSY